MSKAVGVLLAVLLLVVTGAGCGGGLDGPVLKASVTFDGESSPNAKPHVAYTIALAYVCTTGAPLSIERIEPTHPTGNLEIADWGTRYRHKDDSYGEYEVPLSGPVDQTPGFGRHSVAVGCAKWPDSFEELTIAVSINASRATMTGVWIFYKSFGGTRKVRVAYSAAYCVGPGPCPEVTKAEGAS